MDQELREIHTTWLQSKGEEEEASATATDNAPTGPETPIAFVSQDLPATTIIEDPYLDLGITGPPPLWHDMEFPSAEFTDDRIASVSSPTLSISTVSDLAPTELDDDIGEYGGDRMYVRHETLYIGDGNVEVVCGHTIFRVHSSVVSFSSPTLRDVFSPSTLPKSPMPEGCPRIVLKDSAEDFSVLLRMIYTPGYVLPPLGVCLMN